MATRGPKAGHRGCNRAAEGDPEETTGVRTNTDCMSAGTF